MNIFWKGLGITIIILVLGFSIMGCMKSFLKAKERAVQREILLLKHRREMARDDRLMQLQMIAARFIGVKVEQKNGIPYLSGIIKSRVMVRY